MSLAELREQIDAVDAELVHLLCRRATLSVKIGEKKQELGIKVQDPGREDKVLARVQDQNTGPINNSQLARIYRQIIDVSSEIQAKDLA